MSWAPHVTVAAIVEKNGKFLLVEEHDANTNNTVINQPAGHLEPGETLINAVVRETLEEAAWEFAPESIVGIYRWKSDNNSITYLRFAFTGQLLSHHPDRALDKGIVRAFWLSPEEIAAAQTHHRSPQVQRGINDYLAGQRYPLALLKEGFDQR